ncbi:MarR family winged helix-turn-helix transcriptional regulator [Roseovarius pelagicus]|uniref:MarR family transcriptional regulator n=1 Tax=Roseovarius pelagicus TaxID=2980108 RepID=A0ABY6DAP4_9RHOB|nr:helix-turn-helix domain-containing protein [Roseovarius pelagicus]UXX83182.1 MarR family transcriptional regulator [Roseovarius pelagicus]
MGKTDQIRALITRLGRLDAADGWGDDLNPAQRSALDYLSRANELSRSPSHVAEYLGTTRGTASQTLKALLRKGFVTEIRSESDRRSIQYDVAEAGHTALLTKSRLLLALSEMPDSELSEVHSILAKTLEVAADRNGFRPFGICQTCRYFAPRQGGGHCKLLNIALAASETKKICHEHSVE